MSYIVFEPTVTLFCYHQILQKINTTLSNKVQSAL